MVPQYVSRRWGSASASVWPGHGHAEDAGRDARLDFGREPEGGRVEGGVADRLAAERVESRGQVSVGPEGLHQSHRRRHVRQVGGAGSSPEPGRPRDGRAAGWVAVATGATPRLEAIAS